MTGGWVPDPVRTPQAVGAFDASNRVAAGSYDAAGNQTGSPGGGETFRYDGENRQVEVNGGLARYSYDGDGRRVRRVAGGVTTLFVYDALGRLLGEYASDLSPSLGPLTD